MQQNCKSKKSQFFDVYYLFPIIMFLTFFFYNVFPFMNSPSHLRLTPTIFPHQPSLPVSLSNTEKHTHTLTISLITSLLHSVISGQSRSEVFIFRHPITKQLVLPDIERHFERERPSPGPRSI